MSSILVLTFSSVIDISHISWGSTIGPSPSQEIKVSADNIALYATVAGLLTLPVLLDILNDRIILSNEFSMYEAVLTTQHLLSRTYNTIKATPFNISANNKRNIRRVFICTTMYQESHIEMDRLLASIRNVSVSKLLKRENVVLESHIFLDNGADGQNIKQFGLQLLGLIEENLLTDRDLGVMLYTPYGIQLSWKIDNEMPLFVHLKDVSKVNAKKRWSQVMYMKYVLNYRSSNFRKSSANVSKNSSFASLLSVESMDSSNEKRKATQNNLTVPDNKSKSLIKDNESEITSVETETTTIPYVEIFIGDTSSIEKISVTNGVSNSIYTITDSEQIYHEEFKFDCDDYILATDADMTFVDTSIMDVLHVCESDPNVGAVCGRTRPKGVHIHPIVWLQMFDYAKDFWTIKSSQNIIGSVMCCPGCFSMYKLNAVREVVDEYSGPVEKMEDVFTKDSGEDRWMCTLLMLKGWKLRYSSDARNTTFCPEDTYEFMKQRRRWLLSDYANAILVIRKLGALLSTNDAFSVLYVLYLLQLFLIMLLYPGSTIVMMSIGLELATGAPLIVVTPVIVAIAFAYCLMLLSEVASTVQLIITKILIMVFGAGTVYTFVVYTVIIFKDLAKGFQVGHFERAEGFLVMLVLGSYIYGAMLYPTDMWILVTGVAYLFFIPFMNMILPLYAICNIVDQSWGTRDNQTATVPTFLHLPKIKRKMKKRLKFQQVNTTSLRSLSASSVSLSDYNQTEFEFWEELVSNVVGSSVSKGLSNEDRILGLKRLRKKALMFFFIANLIGIIALIGLYGFLVQTFSSKSTFTIVMAVTLGLSPLILISGSTVYRVDDTLNRIGRWINNIA
ncbi:CHS1 [Mytilus coruscus]|uniref:chitin synthase n=1 Tax=Mytilus coruscus TaxID=42192 RepID=A0A6J8C2T0_MYTCO|nr:CHS1 [Mytilus coruscus]